MMDLLGGDPLKNFELVYLPPVPAQAKEILDRNNLQGKVCWLFIGSLESEPVIGCANTCFDDEWDGQEGRWKMELISGVYLLEENVFDPPFFRLKKDCWLMEIGRPKVDTKNLPELF